MCNENEKKEIWEAIDALQCSISSIQSILINNLEIDKQDEDIQAIDHWVSEIAKKI